MTSGRNIQKTLEYSLHVSVFMVGLLFYQLFVFQTRHWK